MVLLILTIDRVWSILQGEFVETLLCGTGGVSMLSDLDLAEEEPEDVSNPYIYHQTDMCKNNTSEWTHILLGLVHGAFTELTGKFGLGCCCC